MWYEIQQSLRCTPRYPRNTNWRERLHHFTLIQGFFNVVDWIAMILTDLNSTLFGLETKEEFKTIQEGLMESAYSELNYTK